MTDRVLIMENRVIETPDGSCDYSEDFLNGFSEDSPVGKLVTREYRRLLDISLSSQIPETFVVTSLGRITFIRSRFPDNVCPKQNQRFVKISVYLEAPAGQVIGTPESIADRESTAQVSSALSPLLAIILSNLEISSLDISVFTDYSERLKNHIEEMLKLPDGKKVLRQRFVRGAADLFIAISGDSAAGKLDRDILKEAKVLGAILERGG